MQNYHHIILPVIQLMVYNRTIARYIADSKVVCQRLRQATRFSLDNSWARRRLKHLSSRSQWIILCTLEHRIAVSREISRADRCLFGLSSWLSTRSSTAMWQTLSTAAWLPDNCFRLADSLQRTVDAFKYPTLVGKFTQHLSCTIPL